jgi:hypothetical protein
MELLHVTWVMWNLTSFHLETVLVYKIGTWFVLDVPQAQKSFWNHSMVLPDNKAQVEARFGPL